MAVVAAALAMPAVAGFDAENVSLHAHLPLSSFGNPNFAEDCWGYVSESGREYAIIGLSTGTAFVEITDPDNPSIVDVVTTQNRGRDMKVYQHYVYSSSDGGPLHVIDVIDIDNGNVTLVDSFPDGGTHNLNVNPDTATLYLAIGGPLVALDLSNPVDPQFSAIWNGETHDAQVVSYTDGPYAGREIAFICAGREDSLNIVDFTDRKNVFLVGSSNYPNASYAHQGWLSPDRQLFYMSDELDDENRTSVFDVSDIAKPVYLGDYTHGSNATDHNLYTRDGFIFEADYTSGLRVFDACEDPVNPVEVGYFDTYPDDNDPGFDGAWSNYPYFPSGTVIVSDRSNGLFVLDVSAAVGKGCGGACTGDVDGSGAVDFDDLLFVLAAWGPCEDCDEDLDDDGDVDFDDLLLVLAGWGPCE